MEDRKGVKIIEAFRVYTVVEQDGEILVIELPGKKGQQVKMMVLIEPVTLPERPRLTARQLRHSGLIGLWKDREDITDSAAYARQLRERAQRQQG